MALTGTLQPRTKKNKSKEKESQVPQPVKTELISINDGNITLYSVLQILFFVAALIMTGIFGYKVLAINTPKDNHKDGYIIVRETKLRADTTKRIDTLFIQKK